MLWDEPDVAVKVPESDAHEIPEKLLVDTDSRAVAMEVGNR